MENLKATNPIAETLLQPDTIKPFENIALAFSGGGFRAASFSLGVFSYLNDVKFENEADDLKAQTLLQQVSYLSSASGGTIATTLYALYNAQGKSFGEFYAKLSTALTGDELLKHALEILADKKYWEKTPEKGRNIINAFSLAYDQYLFDGLNLQSLYHNNTGAHLQEVCFNATEFYTGQSFRQTIKLEPDIAPDPYFNYGNMVINLKEEVAGKIKLGDVLAASSCFPAGFEPVVFPEDFAHAALSTSELKEALNMVPQTGDKQETEFISKKHFGLMDGGITDNQGLQSLMDADERRIKEQTSFEPFNLMLVNDVGSHYIHPYVMPEIKKGSDLSISGTFYVAILFLALCITGIWYGLLNNFTVAVVLGSLLAAIPLIYAGGLLLIRHLLFGASKSSSGMNLRRNFTEKIISLLLGYFTKTPLTVIKQMLSARAQSVLMLNTSIFLKRIRQLLYDKFYGTPRWENRGKGNHVYDLSFSNNINRYYGDSKKPVTPNNLDPSRDIQIVAQVAFNMGTTLWFDKQSTDQEHSEACLIATGQFTTCYNLLQYTDRLLTKDGVYDEKYRNRLLNLKTQMMEHYEHFKVDPFFMYNESGRRFNIPGFVAIYMKNIPCPKDWDV